MQSHQQKCPMENPEKISMYNRYRPATYLKPKCCIVKPFFENGIQQPKIWKFMGFLEN
jgi:hypothetical protein